MEIINPGRIVNLDPRSTNYTAPLPEVKPKTISWDFTARVLDQGNSNFCVGMTVAQFMNAEVNKDTRIKLLGSEDKYFDENTAIQIYTLATSFDEFDGQYPYQDTGSSGLAGCKAAVQLGYMDKYEHVFGFDDFLKGIQISPIMIGTFWYRSMFTPDEKGFVSVVGDNENMGHEYLAIGINMEEEYVECLSSWGEKYGINGRFKVKFSDFKDLLHWDGDQIIPSLVK